MSFSASNRAGSNEILNSIGAGGMGEVDRARNTRSSSHHLRFDNSAS